MDQVSLIIDYESGELSAEQTINLFAELIRSGLCWQLQGHYGRTATKLIDRDIINTKGEINIELVDELLAS